MSETFRTQFTQDYVAQYGPITRSDLAGAASYTWLNDPWPWDYKGNTEG